MELRVNLDDRSYDIHIKKGLFNDISQEVKSVYRGEKIFILTDKNVDRYYGESIKSRLEVAGFKVKKLVLEAGEATKSFETLPTVFNEMLDFKMTRSDLLIALGGGVIGDLGGFVASSFLRGISFIQCPTSLLAQVDSSVGGKVAVDLPKGKNLIGAFYHPKKVIIDPLVLETLEDRFFRDGMAEVIKYGCIKDKKFFEFLESLKSKEDAMNNIEYIIHNCCNIKRIVVENDELDKGERMLLNFGHTIGHAIEQYYNYDNYSHGEGVAIGMYEITKLSEEKGLSPKGEAERIKEILIQYGLPYEADVNLNNILDAIALDKKNLGNTLNIILLKEIGESFIYKTNLEFFIKED